MPREIWSGSEQEYKLLEQAELAGTLPIESVSMLVVPEVLPIARVPGFEPPELPDRPDGNDMEYAWHLLKDGDTGGYFVLEITWPQEAEVRRLSVDLRANVRRLPLMIRQASHPWLGLTGVPKGQIDLNAVIIVMMDADPIACGFALACEHARQLEKKYARV